MVKPEESDVELMKLLPGTIEDHLPKDALKVQTANAGRHFFGRSIREAQGVRRQGERGETGGLRGGGGFERAAL